VSTAGADGGVGAEEQAGTETGVEAGTVTEAFDEQIQQSEHLILIAAK
jgi:hypothetical protein